MPVTCTMEICRVLALCCLVLCSSAFSPSLLGGRITSVLYGLSYKDVVVGEGDRVASGDLISVHYVGKFKDKSGKDVVFEDSRAAKVNRGVMGAMEGDPIKFPIGKGNVIAGWEQGILGNKEIPPMRAGGMRKLSVPAELAYGKEGRGVIRANQDLEFEVELTSIDVVEQNLVRQAFFLSIPAVGAILLLNSIYLFATGQA